MEITIAVSKMLGNIDNDLLNLYFCIQYAFTGFNLMTKRLRPDVLIHGSGYTGREKKKSKNRSDYTCYKIKFMILLI